MKTWKVSQYSPKMECEWDEFVEKKSYNGTFLQTRKFLNYHGIDKFVDCSLMFYYNNNLVAVCPACECYENGAKIYYSHKGTTYGGLICSDEVLRVERMEQLLEEFERYLTNEKYSKCVLKATPDILCGKLDNLLNFCLEKRGFISSKELNLYVDLKKTGNDILTGLSKTKRRQLKDCVKNGLLFKELTTEKEIDSLLAVISENLKKYEKRPVHSLEELLDIKNRFGDRVFFYGVFCGESLVAGTMVFLFEKVGCVHTQYLGALNMNKTSPMTLVYYSIMEMYKKSGYNTISWGIATDHDGNINYSLMRNKEEFGSVHCHNVTFCKLYSKSEGEYESIS